MAIVNIDTDWEVQTSRELQPSVIVVHSVMRVRLFRGSGHMILLRSIVIQTNQSVIRIIILSCYRDTSGHWARKTTAFTRIYHYENVTVNGTRHDAPYVGCKYTVRVQLKQ